MIAIGWRQRLLSAQEINELDFSTEQTPDATTLLHFRHLLEKHDIARKMFDDVKERLDAVGLIMHGGTIVDATIIHALRSTKNATKSRDPEMHSTKKGNHLCLWIT